MPTTSTFFPATFEKKCTRCDETKPCTDFYPDPDCYDGRKPVCSECSRRDELARRDSEPPRRLATRAEVLEAVDLGIVTARAIAEWIGVSSVSIAALLRYLERDGLVREALVVRDKRMFVVTASGMAELSRSR